MSLCQALEQVYNTNDGELLNFISSQRPTLFEEDIPMASLQVLIILMSSQEDNGSWEGVCELTAYAVLALTSLAHLPWLRDSLEKCEIVSRINRGKAYLLKAGQSQWAKGEYLWVEKVTYSSPLLSEVYCLAAVHVALPDVKHQNADSSTNYTTIGVPDPSVMAGMRRVGATMAQTTLLAPSELDKSRLHFAELQATYALRHLQRHQYDVFPQSRQGNPNVAAKQNTDKYLMFVPLTWTACSALYNGRATSLLVLRDMMLFSMLVYQTDEFVEGFIQQDLGTSLQQIKDVISCIARDGLHSAAGLEKDLSTHLYGQNDANNTQQHALINAEEVFRKLFASVLSHPSVQISPRRLRTQLIFELETFLLAHITQAEDNRTLAFQRSRFKATGDHSDTSYGDHGGSNLTDAVAQNIHGVLGFTDEVAVKHKGSAERQRGRPDHTSLLAGRTFYKWVRSTSADHTSCPLAFSFFNCLISYRSPSSSSPSPPSPRVHLYELSHKSAYLAEDLCRHLASMCRMYNDYACVARDRAEGNVNSLDFTEFQGDVVDAEGGEEDEMGLNIQKGHLMWIAEYEREGMQAAMAKLEEEIASKNLKLVQELLCPLKLFISVTDLYGLIYVIRDITNRRT